MKNFPKISQETEELYLNLYKQQTEGVEVLTDSQDNTILEEFVSYKLIEPIKDNKKVIFTSFGVDFAKVLMNKNLRSSILKKMTVEDYLLAVYYLLMSTPNESEEINIVSMTDIARYLGLSNSSISEYIRIIEKDGYLNVIPRKGVTLTKLGKEKAIRVIAKRNTLIDFFNSILKIDLDLAEVESHVLEHNVSPIVIERINLLVTQLEKINFSLSIEEDVL